MRLRLLKLLIGISICFLALNNDSIAVSTFTKGEQMIPVLNRLGTHCAVYGNHDFGKDVKRYLNSALMCTLRTEKNAIEINSISGFDVFLSLL